jgi:hypothetical protein
MVFIGSGRAPVRAGVGNLYAGMVSLGWGKGVSTNAEMQMLKQRRACDCFASRLSCCCLLQVRAWYQSKQYFAGSFETEEEAARAYDRQILSVADTTARIRNRLNFPLADYHSELAALTEDRGGELAMSAFAAVAAAGAADMSGFVGGSSSMLTAAAAAAVAAEEAGLQGLAGSKRGRVPSLTADEAGAVGAAAAAAAAGLQFAGGPGLSQQQQQHLEVPSSSVEEPSAADVTPFADQGWLGPELMQQLHAEQEWTAAQQQQQQQQQQAFLQVQSRQQQPSLQQQQDLGLQLGSPQLPGTFSPLQQQQPEADLQQQQQQQQQQDLLLLETLDGQQQYLAPAGLHGQQHPQAQQQQQQQQQVLQQGHSAWEQPLQAQLMQQQLRTTASQQQQQCVPVPLPVGVREDPSGLAAAGAATTPAGLAGVAAEQLPPLLVGSNPAAAAGGGAGDAGGQLTDAQLVRLTEQQL